MNAMEYVTAFLEQYFPVVARFAFIFLALIIFINIRWCIYRQPKAMRVLAVLDIQDGAVRLPITHYENTIGRSKSCDIVIPLAVISRQHAVLYLAEDGFWRIADTGSKGGILVNGQIPDQDTQITIGDTLSLAELKMVLQSAKSPDAKNPGGEFKKINAAEKIQQWADSHTLRSGSTNLSLILLGIFQVLAFVQLFPTFGQDRFTDLFISFGILTIVPWVYKTYSIVKGLKNISAEMLAFFLCTIGACTTASASPNGLVKQMVAMVMGVVLFCVICQILKNLKNAMKLRMLTGILSIALLAITLVLGQAFNGQRNWISFGFITVQPSELVKVLFVFTGSATLEWLLTTRNLAILTIYSTACIGLLFIAGDFGTALIFFVAFIVLILMTSGDIRAIAMTCLAAGLGAVMIISYKPYILRRFSSWRNIWSHMYGAGYQQTRALMAIASGGLLGLGGGNGFLKNVTAADTDMVFAVICEEWGLIIGLIVIWCFILLLRGAVRTNKSARSSFYIIAACTAGAIFIFQAALNVFGSTDILPFTGVTLPFVSNGGTSMLASWGLLSFISAALNNVRPKTDFTNSPEPKRRRTKENTVPLSEVSS